MENDKKEKVLLIDGHGLAFRGFYAIPEMNAPDGTPTNAIFGFINMLIKAMDQWRPDRTALFFDPHGPTARNAMYGAYKEGRAPTPESFKPQMPLIMELSRVLGFPVFVEDGTEADDLIAATATAAATAGMDVIILSADKDLLQTLRPGVTLARPTKGITEFKLYDEASFTEEYGFPPKAMADYLALVGDSVDNIPGVPGIGDKTARSLLASHGALGAIYEALDSLTGSQRKKLESGRQSAFLSYDLIVPQSVRPMPVDLLRKNAPDAAAAYDLCARLGLKRLISRLGLDESASGNGPTRRPHDALTPLEADASVVFGGETLILSRDPDIAMTLSGEFAELSGETMTAFIEWLSPERPEKKEKKLILAGYGNWLQKIPALSARPRMIRDVEIAHYFLHPDAKAHDLAFISGESGVKTGAPGAVRILEMWRAFAANPRSGSMESVMEEIDAPLVPVLAALGSNGIYADPGRLRELDDELKAHISQVERDIWNAAGGIINLNSTKQVGELLFERLRLPAVKKTKTGYSTDVGVLEELSRLPAPLCDIPRKMLDFRECSKMSSGFVHPFLKHAALSPDGRIHSTFLHTATGTARLASRDPNVQNLPVFGEWAVKFRQAIRPGEYGGTPRVFVAADYSQIELRVLAHLSGEERLLEAFLNNRDIHRETASWVFGVPPEDVTPEQRRFAKTVNFGLLYGMGAHGLAERMGISRYEAAGLVDRYFSALPRVKDYIEESANEAKARGYTISEFGRVRSLAEVTTVEGRGGNSIGRVAVNTPIQSAAADIAKIALIRFQAIIAGSHPDTLLVLQVHDSLICETPLDAADEIESLLVKTMESVKCIKIPLKAESKRGYSLADV
ncbi:MAG: DNA polymerase I [Synergistaceae bacterium]|nr:DNA polymerase I [Synergistaceae bacterium]